MDLLIHFYEHKCLFKCDKRMFNVNVKCALTKLFSRENINEHQFFVLTHHHVNVRCIICLQIVSTIGSKYATSSFVICSSCCHDCNPEFALVAITVSNVIGNMRSSIVQNVISYERSYRIEYSNVDHKNMARYEINNVGFMVRPNSKNFINNSYKLMHRFYHTTILIFLMAISDHNSHRNTLNMDITFHILRFIY